MIGGLFKSSSRAAMIAAAGLLSGGVAAQAADLGGNCCADLEERVAELEATTARKGNRRVSLQVSGHVNEGVLYWDDGIDDDFYVVTNVQSRTRFRFRGQATINVDWSVGFLLEMGMTRPGAGTAVDQDNDDARFNTSGLDIRHQALWIRSRQMGTIWVGHTSDATDGITQICLGCASGNYHHVAGGDHYGNFQLRTAAGANAGTAGSFIESAEGTRQALVKYVSPTFAGFSLTASWHDEERGADDGYAVALRYAGEFGAIRVAAGVGYEDQNGRETTGGSLSVAHTPTGLYVAGSLGEEDSGPGSVDEMWAVSAGINARWNSLGRTHFGGYYGNNDIASGARESDAWGLDLTQRIDAASMQIYLQYHNLSGSTVALGDLEDLQIVYAGARIAF